MLVILPLLCKIVSFWNMNYLDFVLCSIVEFGDDDLLSFNQRFFFSSSLTITATITNLPSYHAFSFLKFKYKFIN